jgi:hypothetical protein
MRSKDTGTGRKILAKVEVPLSVNDITVYALRYLDDIGENDMQDTLLQSNKREIFSFAKNAIFRWGTEEPHVYVKNKLNGHFSGMEQIVKHKFPECD